MEMAKRYYNYLGKIAKYKNAEEVLELPERTRVLFDMTGLAVMSLAVATKCYELGLRVDGSYLVESDQLIEPMNALVKVIDDEEMKLTKYFTLWNETTCASIEIAIRTDLQGTRIEDLVKMCDVEGFEEFCREVFREFEKQRQQSNSPTERMNLV